MNATAVVERGSRVEPRRGRQTVRGGPARGGGLQRALRRPVVAALVLGVVYLAAAFAVAPKGEVADVGGKLATMRVMAEHDSWTPDVGYWAERLDPDGSLHPLHFTTRAGESWVQVTTLPMLYAAYPLYRVGGDRAVVLLPIAAAVLCAFAARALARPLRAGDGWTAYWAVGLATPVFVYALSFWEHTIGLALMAWALVWLIDVRRARAGVPTALLAGLCFGLAATMRTEALVYAATATIVVAGALALDRRWRAAWRVVVATTAGLAAMVVANQVIEHWVVGGATRSSRTAGTAGQAVRDLGTRVDLATTTVSGINGFTRSIDWIVGAVAVALLVAGVLLVRVPARRVLGFGLVVCAATLYVLRFSEGLGFVPGVLTASPLAAIGLCTAWRRADLRLVGVLACAPVPIVWATQYADTMRPQWGARYLFASGLLLAVVAVVVLRGKRAALVTALAAGVVVTSAGVAFVVVRSNSIADGTGTVIESSPAIVSLDPHFFREAGARYDPESHWLVAQDAVELRWAAQVFTDAGDAGFTIVARSDDELPSRLGSYERLDGRRTVTTRPGESLEIVEYHRA